MNGLAEVYGVFDPEKVPKEPLIFGPPPSTEEIHDEAA